MSTKTFYLQSQGEFFHIYNRGVNQEPIFLENRNYDYFIQRIGEYYEPAKMEIVSYCLMPNHFHFIVRQVEANGVTEFFKGVCGGYVKAVNKAYVRSGHLFEGKYKMKFIDTNEYLIHLSRYIHLNPVRAGLVMAPECWSYSSYSAYTGVDSEIDIKSEYILHQFNGIAGYMDFVRNYKVEDKKKIEELLF
ncbi:MAG: transposase [Bacteroidetes bacterium]|nr:transposase [Bacteroidota bacterium]